ncbi:MAG: peptidoglycan DD-metalloendopeptidase family protein [Clostridia bacterium]|nr:peptidoglycan DD-metalloendopeptidase family protein [Clostridia bacterium]
MKKSVIAKAMVCLMACMCGMFFFAPPQATQGAPTKSELKDQIAELEKDRDKLKAEVADLKAERAPIAKIKNALDKQVDNLEQQIEACTSEIYKLDESIAESKAEIAAKEKKLDESKALFRKRIRALYMSGGSSELMMLLDSENFADFLAKTELTRKVTERDKALMEKIMAEIAEINMMNADVNAKIAEQDEIRKVLQGKQRELEVELEEVNSEYYAIDKEYKDAVDNLEDYQDQLDDLYEDLAQLEGIASGQNIKFDGEFIWPCPGYYNITSKFGKRWGRLHRGIDIASSGISGKAIVAAATGTVLKAGRHSSYGNYVVINHGKYEGKLYYTLYAHMSKTPLVKVGQHVNRGQTIGYVGSTGNSTGPHLHFEVQVGGEPKNPMNYF